MASSAGNVVAPILGAAGGTIVVTIAVEKFKIKRPVAAFGAAAVSLIAARSATGAARAGARGGSDREHLHRRDRGAGALAKSEAAIGGVAAAVSAAECRDSSATTTGRSHVVGAAQYARDAEGEA